MKGAAMDEEERERDLDFAIAGVVATACIVGALLVIAIEMAAGELCRAGLIAYC